MKKTYIYILIVVVLIGSVVFFYVKANKPSDVNMRVHNLYPQTYTDAAYHFSVNYPANLTVSSFPNPSGVGEIILLNKASTGMGLQISVAPFDEPATIAITAERIRHDVPNVTLLKPEDIVLDGIGKGVFFLDGTASTSHAQAWFVADDNLYQITAPVDFATTTRAILDTWQFTTQ